MRPSTLAQVRHAVNSGRYDERDMEDLLCDLQEQLEETDGLDFHGLSRDRALYLGEENS